MSAPKRAAEFSADYYRRCEAAPSLDALSHLLFEATDALGLAHVACGAHVDPLRPPVGAFLFHNYHKDWVSRFSAKNYGRIDPVLCHAARQRRAFDWDSDEFQSTLTQRQKRILYEAREFRIANGFTIPLRHDYYLPASISVISESGDIDEWVRIAAGMIGTYVYQSASMLVSAVTVDTAEQLSRRERECLDLKAHGARDDEIAARLGISISTVCRHIDQAKLRLRAKSREHAIWRAVETRQILR